MALEDGQIEFRGLTMGAGTAYRVLDSTNFASMENRDTGSGSRAWSDGEWYGPQFRTGLAIPLTLLIDTTSMDDCLTALDHLKAAFRPVRFGAEVPFSWRLGSQERMVMARPVMVDPDLELLDTGRAFVQCAIKAGNPVAYSAEEQSVTGVNLPVYLGGHTVPFTVPHIVTGYQLGGRSEIANEGNRETGLRVVFNGPISNPGFRLESEEGTTGITVYVDLSDTDELVIDTAAKTVFLNDITNRRGAAALSTPGVWPSMEPGEYEIVMLGVDDTHTSSMDVFWRHAWH